jgi:two-component system, OmpR family, sensor histidine kinase MprB
VTLRWRIALILAAVALVVGGVAAFVSYLSTSSQLRSSIDDTLRSRAVAVNIQPGDRGGRGNQDDGTDCPAAGLFQPASGAQLVAVNGTVTACIAGGPALPTSDADRALPSGAVSLRTVSIGGEEYRLLSTPWHDGGTLQIARSLGETNSLLDRLRLQLALLVLGAGVVAAALGWLVATRLVRPIVRLRDATHRIATTLDLSTPIEVRGSGEVGDLASSFATMVTEVDRSQQQQRRLVSDASHEMRTPLTSLRSNVELIEQIERLPIEERREVVGDILEDVDELTTLLGELVELASDLSSAEDTEPIDLADVARAVAARTERRTNRTVTVRDANPVVVNVRPRQLERVISNLVDNAVKYSEAPAPIDVVVDGASVTVCDRGRGIPVDDLARIFDRFYRAVDVRTEPGSGLGLAIVDEIVRSHGGSVFARNRADGGAEIGFTLAPGSA